jgi:uncharacterized protein YyaL (SSP411 family)
MAVTTLLKPAGFTSDPRYVDLAHQALAQIQSMVARHPLGFGLWLQALGYALSQPKETGALGDSQAADTQTLLVVVRTGYRPFQVVALGAPDRDTAVPLLGNRGPAEGPSPVPWARSLRMPRFHVSGADYGTGGTAGAARALIILGSIEHAARCW